MANMIKNDNATIAMIDGRRVTVCDKQKEHWLAFKLEDKKGLYEFDGHFYIPLKAGRILYYADDKTKRYDRNDWL
jgi:hypothetical protein